MKRKRMDYAINVMFGVGILLIGIAATIYWGNGSKVHALWSGIGGAVCCLISLGLYGQQTITTSEALGTSRPWLTITPTTFQIDARTQTSGIIYFTVQNVGRQPALDATIFFDRPFAGIDWDYAINRFKDVEKITWAKRPDRSIFPEQPYSDHQVFDFDVRQPEAYSHMFTVWGFVRYRVTADGPFHYTPFVWDTVWAGWRGSAPVNQEIMQSLNTNVPNPT